MREGVVEGKEEMGNNSSIQWEVAASFYEWMFSDGGAEILKHNNCLKTLNISKCRLDDQGVESLASTLEMNNSLEVLDLSENEAVTGVGLMALGESLKKNRGLETLSLGGLPNISDSDWKQFVVCLQVNKHLTKLSTSIVWSTLHHLIIRSS